MVTPAKQSSSGEKFADLSIEDIAHKWGNSFIAIFSRAFKIGSVALH